MSTSTTEGNAMTEPMDRAEAMDAARTIWRLSRQLETCGFRDLEPRAAEVCAIAHFMLYDDDAGIVELRG
jgi:hypothetical protein